MAAPTASSMSTSTSRVARRSTNQTVQRRPPSVVRGQPARLASTSLTTQATGRRDALLMAGGLVALSLPQLADDRRRALAAEAEAPAAPSAAPSAAPTTYADEADGFSLAIPKGWSSGEGSLSGNASFSGSTGSRRAVAFFDPSAPGTSVVVVIGNTSPEFTKMSSFGTSATFSEALVNSMDRGFLLRAPGWVRAREAGPGGAVQVARLLDNKEVDVPGADGGGTGYLTDYTIAQVFPDGGGNEGGGGDAAAAPKRRLLSVAALHTTARGYRRIVTVTAQTLAGEQGEEEARVATLRSIVGSLRIA